MNEQKEPDDIGQRANEGLERAAFFSSEGAA